MASDAVGSERISKIVGYKLAKGDFSNTTPNLPQRVVILAEANFANQGSLDVSPKEITSAQQAGTLYGFGSPIYNLMRILRPNSGSGIGGIPTIVIPQAQAPGAVSKIFKITPVGIATGNGIHTLVIGGREGVDGTNYDIPISQGDSTATICDKIQDAVNNVLGAPVIGTSLDYDVRLETKWKGLTAQDLTLTMETNENSLGLSYAITTIQSGIATPSISAALATFGNDWNTIVLNSYGAVSSVMDALEAFNGIPDPNSPTGRYTGIIMKPFIAVTGSVLEDPSTITDSRKANVTIAIAPAPLSAGQPMEAAANMVFLFARQAQDTPELDVSGRAYPDMPTPDSIGAMANYENRDLFVKKGCSTVDLVAGAYVVQDFVTTYHPVGEIPPQFRYCRNLMIDFNIKFGYYLLEQINVVDHAIAADNDVVTVDKFIKPKQWKLIIVEYAVSLAERALIVDPDFTRASISVNVSTTNPDRLETEFSYKRSGYVRIASTTATAGFNFGTVN